MLDVQFKAVEIRVNFVFNFVPIAVMLKIITTLIRPAISPYSIAVAPDSSRAKRLMG